MGHWMALDSITLWPRVGGKVVRAKQTIKQWKMDDVVDVDRLFLDAVMTVMKSRSCHDVLQDSKAKANVGMNEHR